MRLPRPPQLLLALVSLAAACSDSAGGAADAAAGAADAAAGDPALDLTMREQVAGVEAGELSCAELTAGYLARIEARDVGPDGIHAVLALDPTASAQAAALDAGRGGGARLQCAVLLVKDNLDTAGLATTAGSLALADNVPTADAFVVARARAAGALLLGKGNLSEWANFRGYGSTSGWSSLGGQTRNGADPDFNPCGSSSGSAAAVAAGLVSAALGTETDGSIVCPAAVNGVVGFKPTVGLVSRAGVIPISHSQDTVGPICRDVGDAARLLGVLAGPDPQDPATAAIPVDLDLDFEAAIEGATLDGARLGVVETLTGYDPALDELFAAELLRLEAAGAVLVTVELPPRSTYGGDEFTVLLYEFKVDVDAYLAAHARAGQAGTLAELIAFNTANADAVMPYFGQEIFEAAQATTGLDSPAYLGARDRARAAIGAGGIDAVMAAEELDALVAPTTSPAWRTDYQRGDQVAGSASAPAAVAGYPHLTVPMGRVRGLPVGLSFFASAWQDARVLALGRAYERLLP